MANKSLKTLEKERGVLFTGDVDLSKRYSEEEMDELLASDPTKYVGVDHEDRTKFLKDNGYDVTRENMVNSDLSARQKPSEE
jgi:hypothetical protein